VEESRVVLAEATQPEREALAPVEVEAPILDGETRAHHVAEHTLGREERTSLFNKVQELDHPAAI
jgi:hypothetical protein